MNSDALILCIKSNHALHKSIDGFLFNLTPPFLNELNFAPAFTITWFVEINFAIVTSLSTILKYVLSTMGVSKESISKFLIGNRFHVKLRIPSPFSNRISRWQSTDSSKAYRNTSTFKCPQYFNLSHSHSQVHRLGLNQRRGAGTQISGSGSRTIWSKKQKKHGIVCRNRLNGGPDFRLWLLLRSITRNVFGSSHPKFLRLHSPGLLSTAWPH